MIYRITIDECLEGSPCGKGRLVGVMGSHFLSKLLDQHGIRYPTINNDRVRFYFTEAGWRQAGRIIAVEARRRGHVVRCLRRKEPSPSQIVYRDLLQVAILPARRKNRAWR